MTSVDFDVVRTNVERLRADVPDHVKIIAVTKTFDETAVDAAMASGLRDVGENYAQELVAKHDQVREQPHWHFIGQLQTNKVKSLAPFVDVWHTVDNTRVVDELSKRAPRATVMLQVNLTDDPARGGCSFALLPELITYARSATLDVIGLMGVAPVGGVDVARHAYRRVADAAEKYQLSELSMGMSNDYRIAIEHGATMIRVGSTLFGARHLPTGKAR